MTSFRVRKSFAGAVVEDVGDAFAVFGGVDG
jgi:hypothetical protein